MLAYDYPLLGLFWTMTIFFLWAAWLFAAIWSFIDNFRRHDHGGFAKAAWAIFILLIPLVGVFAYVVAPSGLAQHRCLRRGQLRRSPLIAVRRSSRHPGVDERARRGRAIRAVSPRSGHGTWQPPAGRRSAVSIIEDQGRRRLAELLPIRYGRMVATPFAFYRGAAAVMAADLADTPRTGLTVQLCGDAHLSNFGEFAAPDRRLIFSLNDFDETLPGPFEWDLKRLVGSLAVVGRTNGCALAQRRAIELAAAQSYREAMRDFSLMGSLQLWHTRLDVDEITERYGAQAGARDLRTFRKVATKAESRDSLRAMAKLTHLVEGRPQFIHDPPIVVRFEELVSAQEAVAARHQLGTLLASYTATMSADRRVLMDRFRVADVARKVVGVGSVGTRTWVVLMLGRDTGDPLLMQVKEADPSVLEPYLGPSRYRHQGRRVVEGQRLMQAASDILLGWDRAVGVDGRSTDFFVRQLWDKKGSMPVEQMSSGALLLYGRFCGWTLARAHARSGDSVAIAAYLGTSDRFDRAMADFAESYADQNAHDHAALGQAIASGQIVATAGI